MSTFWAIYWITVAVSLLLVSLVGWHTVKKEGQTITFGDIFSAVGIIFFPVVNVIALFIGIFTLIAANFETPVFRGTKND